MRLTHMVCLLVLNIYTYAQQADTTKLLEEVVISVNRWGKLGKFQPRNEKDACCSIQTPNRG